MKQISTLGRALTVIARAEAAEVAAHEDVDAMHAPGECHALVARNEAKRLRVARKHAEAIARAPMRVIEAQARQRGGVVLNTSQRHYGRLFAAMFAR